MHLKGLDLNLLVVLDALLAEKNTTRAGERLFLSQSATSGALGRLREFFDDPLLVRSGQKMVPTSLAESLVEPVRQLLMQSDAIINYRAFFSPQNSTRIFRLNVGDEVATVLMTKVLNRVRQEAPGVSVEIHSYTGSGRAEMARNLSEYVEEGHLDFLVAPPCYISSHHPSEELFQDRVVCVAWSGNKSIQKTISLEQFLFHGHVVTRFGPHRPEQTSAEDQGMENLLQEAGYERKIAVVVPSFTLKASFVIGTDLVATMQESLAKFYSKYLPLKTLPLPIQVPPFGMHLQWHRTLQNDEGSRWFRNILKETANEVFPLTAKKQVEAKSPEGAGKNSPAPQPPANVDRIEHGAVEVHASNLRFRQRGGAQLQS
ncbi:MAG TPA: LysR family transcriptional regulator [Patescibacteria group bacterium]|nr:LysR family transcriptional regulator [Patescibacteria group bacterium]